VLVANPAMAMDEIKVSDSDYVILSCTGWQMIVAGKGRLIKKAIKIINICQGAASPLLAI
jgi:hypothetical protein